MIRHFGNKQATKVIHQIQNIMKLNHQMFLHKVKSAIAITRQSGIKALISILKSKYELPIPISSKYMWEAGIQSELDFWDAWFRTRGLRWPDAYKARLDPNLHLQPRVADLLPKQNEIHILDVGAGPLTVLGKKSQGKNITITAVDPLAKQYDLILSKYNIQPLIRVCELDAENLDKKFLPNTFDLVFASNSIDHTYNPEKAILKMLEVVKPGCYVLLEHNVNEAENEHYSGFHQWNFSLSISGDFLIGSKFRAVNISEKYTDICATTCELTNNVTLITRIKKR